MKRIASAAAVMALLTVLAVSCKKEKKVEDDSKPVIECEANPNFGEFEIMDDLNADVVVNAKEGIKSATVKFTVFPEILGKGFLNNHIGIKANQGTSTSYPTIDLIDDATAVKWVTGKEGENAFVLFSNSTLADATTVTLHFSRLVFAMVRNQTLENNDKISFTFNVTDKEGQSVSKTMVFHYTSAPEITIKGQSFSVDAPGKVEEATLLVSSLSTSLNAKLVGPLYKGVLGATGVSLDLIGNTTAAEKLATYSVNTGSKLKAQSKVTIDLSKFISEMVTDEIVTDSAYGNHLFTLTIKDALGKTSAQTLIYEFKAE